MDVIPISQIRVFTVHTLTIICDEMDKRKKPSGTPITTFLLRGADLVGQLFYRCIYLALMKINRDRCNKLSSAENTRELVKQFVQLHP